MADTADASAPIVTWEDPLEVEFLEKRRSAELARQAKDEASLARIEHARMLTKGRQVALRALGVLASILETEEKALAWLALQGPAGLANVVKLFEAVNKETRLDNGQATEHVAVAAFNAANLTPEERRILRKGMIREPESDE